MSNIHNHGVNMDTPTNKGKLLIPFQREQLQKSLQDHLHKFHRKGIQIMLLASEGKSQAEICRILKCCPATARHWMHIGRSGMAHQWQNCPIGRPKKVNDEYLVRFKKLVSRSPRDCGYPFTRWTGEYLSRQLAKDFGFKITGQHCVS